MRTLCGHISLEIYVRTMSAQCSHYVRTTSHEGYMSAQCPHNVGTMSALYTSSAFSSAESNIFYAFFRFNYFFCLAVLSARSTSIASRATSRSTPGSWLSWRRSTTGRPSGWNMFGAYRCVAHLRGFIFLCSRCFDIR